MFFLNPVIKGFLLLLVLLVSFCILNILFESFPQLLLEQMTGIDLLFLSKITTLDKPILLKSVK